MPRYGEILSEGQAAAHVQAAEDALLARVLRVLNVPGRKPDVPCYISDKYGNLEPNPDVRPGQACKAPMGRSQNPFKPRDC